MTIKPWLSKNFLQMMQWSNVRDYPPKRKKPWLFDNFMEMEEIHSDHMDAPFEDPILPLPPPPDIPQDPEDVEPDPCAGPRVLWVLVDPTGGVDCDTPEGFTLIFSPDFKCVSIEQIFVFDGPVLADSLGPLVGPVNVEDIVGGLKIVKGCYDKPWITLAICDCLCGGCSHITVHTENCGTDCGAVYLHGHTSVLSYNGGLNVYQLVNLPEEVGTVQWSVIGANASMGQDGTLYTTGACGVLRVIANSSCCGVFDMYVRVVDSGYWQLISSGRGDCTECIDFDANPRPTNCVSIQGEYKYTVGIWECDVGGLVPCVPKGGCTGTAIGVGWEVHSKFKWECIP